jgi:hypothetical protein
MWPIIVDAPTVAPIAILLLSMSAGGAMGTAAFALWLKRKFDSELQAVTREFSEQVNDQRRKIESLEAELIAQARDHRELVRSLIGAGIKIDSIGGDLNVGGGVTGRDTNTLNR